MFCRDSGVLFSIWVSTEIVMSTETNNIFGCDYFVPNSLMILVNYIF